MRLNALGTELRVSNARANCVHRVLIRATKRLTN